jgi:hypothetical protein
MPDDLKSQWRDQCLRLARRPSDPWSPRKILRDQRMTFVLDDSLGLEDIGYTDLKIKALTRLYVHEESRDVALERWNDRRKGKLTSETFHCFNHLTKLSGAAGQARSMHVERGRDRHRARSRLTSLPGLCPGDGWQLLSRQGRLGRRGEKGEPGPRGAKREPGASIVSLTASATAPAR